MFAILFEVLVIENQEEIQHFLGWEGGGSRGTKIVNKTFVNKLAFPKDDQGRKMNPNPNFLVRIFSGGVGVFRVKGWAPKSSVCPSKARETKHFAVISRGFA